MSETLLPVDAPSAASAIERRSDEVAGPASAPAITATPAPAPDTATQNAKDSKAAGIYLYSRTAASILMLITIVAAPWLYGKAGFAYVAAILLIYETAVALGSLGLADAVFYFLGRHPERGAAIVRQTSTLLVMLAVPVVLLTSIVGYDMSGPGLDLVPALPWLALVLLIELPTQPAVNQMLAAGHAVIASVLFVFFIVLRTGVVLLPAFVPGLELTDIPWMMGITGLTRLGAHLYVLRRYYPKVVGPSWFNKAEMKAIAWFALPAGIAAMCGKLNNQVDKYVVKFVIGVEAFANYTVASWELPLINIIPYAIGAVMQVRYVRLYASGDLPGLRQLWYQTVQKTALAVVPLTFMFMVLGHDIITIVFGSDYLAAVVPFQIFTAILLLRVAAYGPMMQATNQTRMMLWSALILIASNLLITVPLTYLIGAEGAALATFLANIPSWLYTLSRIGSALGGGIPVALPWRFYGKVMGLAGAIAIGVAVFDRGLGLAPAVAMPISMALYLASFTVLGRVLGLIGAEDLAFFLRWISFGTIKK